MAVTEKKEVKERFALVRVITENSPVMIQDTETGEQLDTMAVLVKILNQLEQLRGLM